MLRLLLLFLTHRMLGLRTPEAMHWFDQTPQTERFCECCW